MPTFKIDGKQVPFEKGETILQAATKAGIEIPHYCWHPGLSVAANCRMCLVEVLPPPGRGPMLLDIVAWDEKAQTYVNKKKPKLQPACQMRVAENMEVLSDTSEHVTKARASVQELLLLNHPVDCPICDQAGECRLQDYWLEHQHAPKRMREEPVHKPKHESFGPTIMYDAERCILCTRCVRFNAEVVGKPVLSKRERGNLNEITLSPGQQLDHPYSLMNAYICPVGALTSKDFRFKARVWFLKSAKTVCQGCATGCNAWLDYDPRFDQVVRHRPRDNEHVNKYWMCDEGLLSYASVHEDRVTQVQIGGHAAQLRKGLHAAVKALSGSSDDVALVLSAQHSTEDNLAFCKLAEGMGIKHWFLTGKPSGDQDNLLRHADKNPNTAGAKLATDGHELKPFEALIEAIDAGQVKRVLALGSAVPTPDTSDALSKLDTLVTVGVWSGPLEQHASVFLPACSWAETQGTFINAAGTAQVSEQAINPVDEAQPGWKLALRLANLANVTLPFASLSSLQEAMPDPQPSEPSSDTTTDGQATASAET